MNKAIENTAAVPAEQTVHPLLKSHMLVSTRHIDLENLSAFEAVSLALVLVTSVTAGVATSLNF